MKAFRMEGPGVAGVEEVPDAVQKENEVLLHVRMVGMCGTDLNSYRGRITAKMRMAAKLKAIKVELQRRKHDRTSQVGIWLHKVVSGYYQYHAVPGNIDQLRIFRNRVNRLWRNVLVRRSQTREGRSGRSFTPVYERWIPLPDILHPYPEPRFYATHPS